jgi:hypothetical protein
MLIPNFNNNSSSIAQGVLNAANNYKRSNSLLVPSKAGAKKSEPHFNLSSSIQKKKTPQAKLGDNTSSSSSEDLTPPSKEKKATN